jgi:hypothetical protein
MKRSGHVESTGDVRSAYKILVRKPKQRNHLGDPGIDERIILE